MTSLTFSGFSGYCPRNSIRLSYGFYTRDDNLVVLEVLNEAAAAVGVKFREDIVEENDRGFTEGFGDETSFDEFESKDDRAGFAARGGGVGDLVIETKDVVIAVDTETSVTEVNIALSGLL